MTQSCVKYLTIQTSYQNRVTGWVDSHGTPLLHGQGHQWRSLSGEEGFVQGLDEERKKRQPNWEFLVRRRWSSYTQVESLVIENRLFCDVLSHVQSAADVGRTSGPLLATQKQHRTTEQCLLPYEARKPAQQPAVAGQCLPSLRRTTASRQAVGLHHLPLPAHQWLLPLLQEECCSANLGGGKQQNHF